MGLLPQFDIKRESKLSDKAKLAKVNSPKSSKKQISSNTLLDKLEVIRIQSQQYLGKYQERVAIIRNRADLTAYIDSIIRNGVCALDTETTGLDPLTDEVVGVCLYTPNAKAVYIPLLHRSYMTGDLLPNQLTKDDLREELSRIKSTRIIMHHAKFDIRMVKHNIGVILPCYWDTMLATRVLAENAKSAALKYQYAINIEGHEPEYDYDTLFRGIDYRDVPIELAAMYAAVDPMITYELYEYQEKQINLPENAGMKNVLMNIEMPLLPCIVEQEDNGVCIDVDYAAKLSVEYHKKLDIIQAEVQLELEKYSQQIKQYRVLNPDNKLEDPISVTSPVQLAVLLYDIIKVDAVDPKKPRGTGEDILKKINLPLCDKILEYRGVQKLLTTYIDKLPNVMNAKTKRIHASFNQIGADTGRFSSSDPNLQNIPSHNKEIRKMFVASPGCVFVGSDFSQQEPRLLAHFSQDENMLDAYKNKKDLYSTVASKAYKLPYEECQEFRADGTKNPEGKKRRTYIKSVVLGLMYGRGANSIAEQLKISGQEAQEIIDNFYNGFPKVREWMERSKDFARRYGYVETLWGRRRHLPDIQLPYYEAKQIASSKPADFNPFFSSDIHISDDSYKGQMYIDQLNRCRNFRDREDIKRRALADGWKITDNGGFISTAERQCVNSRIQGSAGDMTKRALISIYNNARMKELGFKIILTVHDEIIGECPVENAAECGQLLSQCMIESARPECTCPMKCDVELSREWYGHTIDRLDDYIKDYHNNAIKDMKYYDESWISDPEHPENAEEAKRVWSA